MTNQIPELFEFAPLGGQDIISARQEAARAIKRVADAHQSDLDKLLAVISGGGGLLEQRAAVEAADLIKEIIIGLRKAADLVLETTGDME